MRIAKDGMSAMALAALLTSAHMSSNASPDGAQYGVAPAPPAGARPEFEAQLEELRTAVAKTWAAQVQRRDSYLAEQIRRNAAESAAAAETAARQGEEARYFRNWIRARRSDPGEPLQAAIRDISALAIRVDAIADMTAGLRRSVRGEQPEVAAAARELREAAAALLAAVRAEGETLRLLGIEMRRILRMNLEAKDLDRRRNRLESSAAVAEYEALRLLREAR